VCITAAAAATAAGVHEATIGLAGFVLALLYYYHYVLLFFIATADQLNVIATDVDDDAAWSDGGVVVEETPS